MIAAAAAGDRAAAERFCDRYQPLVRRRLGTMWRESPLRALLGDAVQEVFFECLRPGGALAHVDRQRCPDFDGYLLGVVRNVAARVTRREARQAAHVQRLGEAAELLPDQAPGVPERIDRAQRNNEIRTAIARLDREQVVGSHTLGDLVRQLFGEGQPVRAIAREWHETPEHLYELRRRACRELRRLLSFGEPRQVREPVASGA